MSYAQSGITNRPPGHLLLVALTFTETDPGLVRDATERLRDVHEREVKSDLDETTASSPKDRPSAETGELGFEDGHDRSFLTVTVGARMRRWEFPPSSS